MNDKKLIKLIYKFVTRSLKSPPINVNLLAFWKTGWFRQGFAENTKYKVEIYTVLHWIKLLAGTFWSESWLKCAILCRVKIFHILQKVIAVELRKHDKLCGKPWCQVLLGKSKRFRKKIRNIGWMPVAVLWGLDGTSIPITWALSWKLIIQFLKRNRHN